MVLADSVRRATSPEGAGTMIRYKVRTFTLGGRPARDFVMDWTISHGTPPHYPEDTGPAQERELVLEPDVYIFVWNCRACLAVEFFVPGTSSTIMTSWPYKLPKRVARAMERDILEQGGGLTMSGRYDILSSVIQKFVNSKRFQKWLRREAEELGLEVVEGPDESGSAPAE
jgi:hypothetical protein